MGSEFGGFKAVLIIDAEWLYSTVSLTVDREAKLFGQKPSLPLSLFSLSITAKSTRFHSLLCKKSDNLSTPSANRSSEKAPVT